MFECLMPRRALALAVAAMAMSSVTVIAQTAQEAAPAQPAGALPTFFAGGASNTTCIAEAFEPTSQSQMRLKLVIAQGGTVTGLPYLIEPASPDAGVRQDYLKLVAAIDSCAPFQDWSAGGDYVLTASADGSLSAQPLALTDPAPGVTAAAPAVAAAAIAVPSFERPVGFAATSPELEDLLGLDRAAIRDVQARLLVIGHDPNGVDGVLGNGARSGLAAWQGTLGVEPTGYLNALQLDALKTQSQAQLDVWLQDPSNAAKYSPVASNSTKKKAKRKKKRVKTCKRNAVGILYDCKFVYR